MCSILHNRLKFGELSRKDLKDGYREFDDSGTFTEGKGGKFLKKLHVVLHWWGVLQDNLILTAGLIA